MLCLTFSQHPFLDYFCGSSQAARRSASSTRGNGVGNRKLIAKQTMDPTKTHQGNAITGHQSGNHMPNAQSCGSARPFKSRSPKLIAGNLTLQKTNTEAIPQIIATTFVPSRPRRFVHIPKRNTASNEP